jgi:hypothetical protein
VSFWSQPTALARAKARLDPLALYDRPVRIDHVAVVSLPWLFRLPWFRRFDGYAAWNLILLRSRDLAGNDDLLCHELCHVWQMQHHPVRMPLSYLRFGYARNPYEEEARRAVARVSGAEFSGDEVR